MRLKRRGLALAALLIVGGCEMRFGALPTATLTPTHLPPEPVTLVVWAQEGNLLLWREDAPTPQVIASGGVITLFLAPDGSRVAFTRGAQGDARALWSVNVTVTSDAGTGEAELVAPDVIPSIRGGHPQINQVGWLDAQTVYFNTLQQVTSGSVKEDNLYRAQAGAAPQLILPPGAGGDFALSPDGRQVAVTTTGAYDMQPGRVALLDPLGVEIADKLSFTAMSAPNEPPFYLPLAWNGESSFVRVPVPDRASDRVALWRVPVDGEAQIFGYISALREGLPVWTQKRFAADDQILYLNDTDAGAVNLMLARANGENAQVYASSTYSAGGIPAYRWLPDGERFVYERDGSLWLGMAGQPPSLLLDAVPERIVFLPDGTFVYLAAGELHLSFQVNGVTRSTVIVEVPAGTPFDAGLNLQAQSAP